MTRVAPFKEGDILCLEGPNVANGCHLHVAGEPVLVAGRWCNGYRPWGLDDGCNLRHATIEDASRLMKIIEKERLALIDRKKNLHVIILQIYDKELEDFC